MGRSLKFCLKISAFCLASYLASYLASGVAFASSSPPDFSRSDIISGPATVLDGDTLQIGDKKIILFGVDAPENGQLCQIYDKSWPCGERAKIWLTRYVGDGPVRCLPREGDPFDDRIGGIKAMCFNTKTWNLSATMLTAGLAVANLEDGDWFKLGNVAARVNRKGVWAGKFVPPHQWRAGIRLPVRRSTKDRGLQP